MEILTASPYGLDERIDKASGFSSKFVNEFGWLVGWVVGVYGISIFVGYLFQIHFIQVISSISNNPI